MATATPKLAKLIGEKDFCQWLAETIQAKVAKENAGFVSISTAPRSGGHITGNPHGPLVVLETPNKYRVTLEVTTERVS